MTTRASHFGKPKAKEKELKQVNTNRREGGRIISRHGGGSRHEPGRHDPAEAMPRSQPH